MTKREKVSAAFATLIEKYFLIASSGKTTDPKGVPMRNDRPRAEKMLAHFANGEVKGLAVSVSECLGNIELNIRFSKSTTLDTMFDMIEQASEVLDGPLFETKAADVRRVEDQLQFIGAIRKELDALEKRVRNNRHHTEASGYDFERTVARLRKELWP